MACDAIMWRNGLAYWFLSEENSRCSFNFQGIFSVSITKSHWMNWVKWNQYWHNLLPATLRRMVSLVFADSFSWQPRFRLIVVYNIALIHLHDICKLIVTGFFRKSFEHSCTFSAYPVQNSVFASFVINL